MKMEEYVNSFENWRIATPDDNDRILDFYTTITMLGGGFNVKFERSPDFFKFIHYRNSNCFVYLMEDDNGELEGMGSLSINPCYINGEKYSVGYFSDGRFNRYSRRANKTRWQDFVSGICRNSKDIDEIKDCEYYVTTIMDQNSIGQKGIVKFKKENYGISPISQYNMINILARKPLKMIGIKNGNYKNLRPAISFAKAADLPDLKKFLDKQHKKRVFGFVFDDDYSELERRFSIWDNFSPSSFLIARNREGKIIGCCAPWNTSEGRRITVDRFPGYLWVLSKFAGAFGKYVPSVGNEMKIVFLTHLELDNDLNIELKRQLFSQMLDALYEKKLHKENHIIAYCDYEIESLLPGIKKEYLLFKSPVTMYQFFTNNSKKIFTFGDIEIPPGLEMALA